MASKKVEMYAKKRYELDEIKNKIKEEFDKRKFSDVESATTMDFLSTRTATAHWFAGSDSGQALKGCILICFGILL